MNGNDSFEERLRRVPLREVPPEWRRKILRTSRPQEAARPSLLRALLWPHPVAWAGLAAAWAVVLGLNAFAWDSRSAVAARELPAPSPQVKELLREQERLLAELSDGGEVVPPSPRSPVAPQPRSQRREDYVCV